MLPGTSSHTVSHAGSSMGSTGYRSVTEDRRERKRERAREKRERARAREKMERAREKRERAREKLRRWRERHHWERDVDYYPEESAHSYSYDY